MAFDPSTGYLPGNQGYAPLSAYNQAYDPNSGQQGPTGGVGANPYPNLRYGYQGPLYNPTQGGIDNNLNQGYPNYLGNSIDAMSQDDRNHAVLGGQQLQQNLSNYTGYQYGQSADFQDRLNSAWDPIAQGNGGYTDDQKASILNNPALQALQQTPDQANSLYLNGDQQSAIAGNPYAASDYANQAGQNLTGLYANFAQQVGDRMGDQSQAINGQLVGGANNIRGAYNTQSGKQQQNLSDIAALTRGAQGTARSTAEGAYGNLRSDTARALSNSQVMGQRYLDPKALNASDEYMQNYNVTPRDEQNIEDKAGRTVGAGAAADEETLMQQAASQGNTNPLALAAARNRIRSTGAVNAADAMSNAAIQAKQLQLNTTQGRENTRLGAAQNYAGLGTGANLALGQQQVGAAQNVGQIGVNAELGLGTQGLQNEQYMGSNTLNTQNQLGQNALQSEQYLSGQQQQAQQYLGQSNLSNTQQLLNTGMQQGEFNAALGTSSLANAENQASNRSAYLAGNQQGVNMYNQGQQYDRGKYIYGQGSQANLNFANTQLGQEGDYRKYLGGQQSQYGQNAQIGQQQQLGAYGATNQGAQGATRNSITNYAVPGFGNTLFKDVTGLVAGAAGAFAKGGVLRGSQTALIGEAGPELLVHLNKLPKYGLGGGPFDGSGEGDGPEGNDLPGAGGPNDKSSGESGNPNPFYKRLIRSLTNGASGANQSTSPAATTGDSSDNAQAAGAAVGKGIKGLLGLAQGGMIGGGMGGAPNHYYGSHSKLKSPATTPAIEMIKKPQIRKLGIKGADAVIPLTDRPGNKLKIGDLPNLAKRYGGNFGGKRARLPRI